MSKRSRDRSTARVRLRNDSGQVVHTQFPRRRHSSLVSRVVKLGTFALFLNTFQFSIYTVLRRNGPLYHPTFNDNYYSSCMIPEIVGTCITD